MEKHLLIGNLTRDPETRMVNGKNGQRPVTNFSVAVNKRNNETSFFRISVWDKLAESCARYLHKGSKVFIEGVEAHAHAYTDNSGSVNASVDITAMNVEFLTPVQKGDADDTAYIAPAAKAEPMPVGNMADLGDLPF